MLNMRIVGRIYRSAHLSVGLVLRHACAVRRGLAAHGRLAPLGCVINRRGLLLTTL